MYYYDINIPSTHGYICQKRHMNEDYVSRLHWHSFIEIEFFLDAKGTHTYSNQISPLKQGDLWLLSTSVSHQVAIKKGTYYVNLAFDASILDKKLLTELNVTYPLHCVLDAEERRRLMEKIDVLYYEQSHRGLYTKIKVAAIINEIIVDVLRKTSPKSYHINSSVIHEIVNYLHEHYFENVALVNVAKIFSLTPNYCGHLFKKNMGITYNDYLNTLRLKNACKLLLDTTSPIKEIAYKCGFNSLEYFHTTFKKFYGITPAKYRTLTPDQIANTSSQKFSDA